MQNDSTVFVGLDVHKDSITAACIGSHPSEQVLDLGSIGTQQYAIDRLIKKLAGRGALHFMKWRARAAPAIGYRGPLQLLVRRHHLLVTTIA